MSKPSWADPNSYVVGWNHGYQAGEEVSEQKRDKLRDEAVEAIQENERLHALNRDLERELERIRTDRNTLSQAQANSERRAKDAERAAFGYQARALRAEQENERLRRDCPQGAERQKVSGYSLEKVVWEAALKQEQEIDRLTAALKDAERELEATREQRAEYGRINSELHEENERLREDNVELIHENERQHAENRDVEQKNERLRRALQWIGSSEGEDDAYALAEYAREALNQEETNDSLERLR